MTGRIWVAALGVAALAGACVPGCSAGPHAGGLAATRPPGSADRVCVRSACVSLSRLAHGITTQLNGKVAGDVTLIGRSRVLPPALPARPQTRRSSPWDRMSW